MSVRDSLIFTGLIFLIFGLFLFIAMDDKGLLRMMDQSRTLTKIREENHRVEEVNAELGRSIERLANDMDYVESLARRDLGMVGKEEKVLRFKKDFRYPAPAAASALTETAGAGGSPLTGTAAAGPSPVAAKAEPAPAPAAAKAVAGTSQAAGKAKARSSQTARKTRSRTSQPAAKARAGAAWRPGKAKPQAAGPPAKADSGAVWSPRKGKLDYVASPDAPKAEDPPAP